MHVLGERQQLHMSFVFVGGVLSEGFIFAYVPFHSDPSCSAHCSSLLLRYLGGIIRCCRETQRRRRMQDLCVARPRGGSRGGFGGHHAAEAWSHPRPDL